LLDSLRRIRRENGSAERDPQHRKGDKSHMT
jgi:hypothetical protein